jgi:hypothetical protein
VLLVIVPFSTSFPQTNLANLQKQLPKTIQSNSELLKQVSQTLQRDISLHPDLLAYRLNYYDRLFNQGIKDNNENGLNNLNLITAHYYKMRNVWIKNQLQTISTLEYNTNYKNLSLDFLGNYYSEIADSLNKPQLFLDTNLVDYYAVLAFGMQNLDEYNPQLNYSKERNRVQNEIVEGYQNKLNRLRSEENVDEPIETIIDYWFLFNENSTNQENLVSNYLVEYFSSLYSIEKLNLNTILIGATYYFLEEGIDIEFNQPSNSTKSIIGSISKTAQLDFQISHKFPLKNELSILSLLNLGITGSFVISQNVEGLKPKMVHIRTPQEGDEYVSETWTFSELSIDDFKALSTYFNVSVPIVFFNQDVYLEVGAKLGLDLYSYLLNSKYSYGKVEVIWDSNQQRYIRNILQSEPSGNSSEKKTISKFRIYPTADLTINKFNPIIFQFSVSYNYFSAKIGYNF